MSHARRFVPGVYERQLRKARAYVSCTRSSASSRSGRGGGRRDNLVGQLERLLLEAHAVARLARQPAGVGFGLCHSPDTNKQTPSLRRLFRVGGDRAAGSRAAERGDDLVALRPARRPRRA